jgi:hypothetical protein
MKTAIPDIIRLPLGSGRDRDGSQAEKPFPAHRPGRVRRFRVLVHLTLTGDSHVHLRSDL